MSYTPIRINTIKPSRTLNFDLYIYFKEHYLKYVHNGKEIDETKLAKLKKQKIARFFITDADEENYQSFLDMILEETLNSADSTTEDKVNIVEGTANTAMENMHEDPTSEASYKMTKKAAKSLRQMVQEDPNALKEIYGRKASENELLIKHCLNVSAFATRLGALEDIAEEDLDYIAVAGLVHDIAISHGDDRLIQLFSKHPKDMSDEEKEIYQAHCEGATALLEKNPLIEQPVIDLVISHEERISGSGYPNGKKKLTLGEEIITLVNCYDKMVTVYGTAPKEALKKISMEELGNFNMALINKFKKVLKSEGLLEL